MNEEQQHEQQQERPGTPAGEQWTAPASAPPPAAAGAGADPGVDSDVAGAEAKDTAAPENAVNPEKGTAAAKKDTAAKKEAGAKKDTAARKDETAAEKDASAASAAEKAERAAQVQHNNVNQHFYGSLDARHAHFGIGGIGGTDTPNARRRAIGRLDAGEADAVLESYVAPPCFEEAVRALRQDGVVVLVGPPGTGKRSGAVALLDAVADGAEYVVLSPGRSLEELATGRPAFEKGNGYVLLDRMNEGSSGTADFDWRRVRDAVREQGAHLVVTTVHTVDGEPPESVRHLTWQVPALADVLRVRLRKAGCAETTVEQAVGLLPAGCRIAEAVAAADRIARGADLAGVWQEYGSSAAHPVRDWFAAERSLQEAAEVTTLAFVIGAGRRDFELCQEGLEPYLAPAFPQTPTGPGTATADGAPAAVPRRTVDRRRSLARNDLVATEAQKHGALSRTVLVFRTPQYRQWVLEELWANHSTDYWDGVRDWLTDMVRTVPDPDLQMSVASGLALLARPAFDEVAESYLHPWARGTAGPLGQSTATMVLWWMCLLDENLGATALAVARGWAQSRDPGLRSTAMAAFGGELGVRFPSDAVKWLWHLISRAGDESAEAVSALAALVAVQVASRENAGVVFVFAALAHRMGVQGRTGAATRLKEATFDAVQAVLTVRDLGSGRPVCAVLAGRRPQLIDRFGELWAGLLCNRPRRASALRDLHDTLRALPGTCEKPEAIAGRFGRAVGAALPADERALLDRALRPVAARSDDTVAAALTETFLTAVLSTED
ncbi:nSTAND3 domain-containing NTPase [Streptomyces avermitilis]|uniref:nSTAND3 domain-containing NTPase n=1 Tax=Streptomyces avermitilis TaxID=33903 RepID=UPI00367D5050